MLNFCRGYVHKIGNYNNTRIVLVNASISNMPFQDNSFDVIYSAAVMLHLDKEIAKETISEVRRVLKPRGVAYFYSSFPNKLYLYSFPNVVFSLIKHSDLSTRVRRYSYTDLVNLFNGFSEVCIRPANYRLLPCNIGPLRVPFRDKVKVMNERFSNKAEGFKANIDWLINVLAVHYNVIARL
jgi:ubiquinone/menaquinone biosynthesis C-methylase UbiE